MHFFSFEAIGKKLAPYRRIELVYTTTKKEKRDRAATKIA
jgi:hypothetical protein